MSASTATSSKSLVPVVGIPVFTGKSQHEREILRCPTNLRLFEVPQDDDLQINYRPGGACDNFIRCSKKSPLLMACQNRADTIAAAHKRQFYVCDFCFCSNKWIILALLFALLPSVEAASINVALGSYDLLAIMVFMLLLTYLVLRYVSQMYSQTIKTVEKFMQETTRRHLWDLAAQFSCSLIGASSHAFEVQGIATDFTVGFSKFMALLVGLFTMLNLVGDEPSWFKKASNYVKNHKLYVQAVSTLENVINGEWSFFDTKRDIVDEIDRTNLAMWQSGLRYKGLLRYYTKVGSFNEKLLGLYFEALPSVHLREEIIELAKANGPVNYLNDLRLRERSAEALLIALAGYFQLKIHEIEIPQGNDEKLGLGNAPPAPDIPWLDGSYLMKAAFYRDHEAVRSLMGPPTESIKKLTDEKLEKMWAEALDAWRVHFRACARATHYDCTDFLPPGRTVRECQSLLGAMAWPAVAVADNDKFVIVNEPSFVLEKEEGDLKLEKQPKEMKRSEPTVTVFPKSNVFHPLEKFVASLPEKEEVCISEAISTDLKDMLEDVRPIDLKAGVFSVKPSNPSMDLELLQQSPPVVSAGTTHETKDDRAERLKAPKVVKFSEKAERKGFNFPSFQFAPVPFISATKPEEKQPKEMKKEEGDLKLAIPTLPETADLQGIHHLVGEAIVSWFRNHYSSLKVWQSRKQLEIHDQFELFGAWCQEKLGVFCFKTGQISKNKKVGKMNVVIPSAEMEISPVVNAFSEAGEAFDDVVAHSSLASSVLTETPKRIAVGVATITTLFAVVCCFAGAAYLKSRRPPRISITPFSRGFAVKQGNHVNASGGKDFEADARNWDNVSKQEEAQRERLDRVSEMAADFHYYGKASIQGVQGLEFGRFSAPPEFEKYVCKDIITPISGPSFELQGKYLPDNIGAVINRTFGVFSSSSCRKEEYLLNAFLVGRYMFCEAHNLRPEVVLRSSVGQKFVVRQEQWRLVPGHTDLVCMLWSSPVSSMRVSLGIAKPMDPVVLVSSRGDSYACKEGIVVGLGPVYGWATYESIAGDCCGPVVNNQGLIVGFHQLGTKYYSNGFLKVDSALIEFVSQNAQPMLVIPGEVQGEGFTYERDETLRAGVCLKNKRFCGHFQAYAVANKVPLGLDNYWLPDFKQGVLEEGIRRFDHDEPVPDHFVLQASFADLVTEISTHTSLSQKKDIEYVHAAADLTSSPGFPFCLDYSKKATLFAAKGEIWRDFVNRPLSVYWYAKLKCEVREAGKAARAYLACPVDYAYYSNIYCLDFNEKFYEAGAKLNGFFSTVGMDPHYGGWQKLKDGLFSQGFSFDGKRFDSRVHSFCLWLCCQLRILRGQSLCVDELIWCYRHIIFSKIKTPEGFSASKVLGMPSGGVNTIVDNTMVLYLMVNYAFRKVCSLPFRQHVKLALNGDDSLITLSPEACKLFDAKKFTAVLLQDFGMTFETTNWEAVPLEKLDYLSRFFHTKMSGVVVPYFKFDKTRASLSFSRHERSPGYSLVRAFGIYAEMWTNVEARQVLKGYIEWLKTLLVPGDPWNVVALAMEKPEWEHFTLATGLSVMTIPGELQSATPGKGIIAKPLQPEMDAINKNKIANLGGNKKVPQQKKKNKKTQVTTKTVTKVVRQNNSKILKSRFRAPGAPFRTTLDGGLTPAIEKLRLTSAESRNVVDVFNTVCMPGVGKNIRIGEEFGSRPSGVASLFNREDTSFSILPSFAAQAFVFKSALRYQLTSIAPLEYVAASARSYVGTFQVRVAAVYSSMTCFPAPLLSTNGDGWHGDTVYPGRLGPSDPYYGYLGNVSDRFTIDIPAAAPGTAFHCTIYKFGAKEWEPLDSIAIIAAIPSVFDVTSFGYYAFGFTSPGSVAGVAFTPTVRLALDLGVGVAGTDPCWSQLSLPGLRPNIDTVQNIKFHGLSLMWTNTSNMLSKQGQIAMMQVPADSWFGNYVGYANVASKNVKVEANIDATQGAYLFQKPSTIKDFEFTNEIVSGNQGSSYAELPSAGALGITNTWFYIIPQLDYITIALDIPPVAGISDARTGYWTVRADIEYSSIDQWRSLQMPNVRKDDLERALTLIAAAPQFHTNDFHISDLWNWVKNAAKSVGNAIVEYGPTVLKIATAVAPLLL